MKKNWMTKVVKVALIGVIGVAVVGEAVTQLWNWLTPGLFGWHTIGFWQAIGLLVLSRVLFGGFRGGPGGRMHWRRRMIDRWEQMTPEQREKFRQGMGRRCGGFEAPEANVS